jgi:hypothetical protein
MNEKMKTVAAVFYAAAAFVLVIKIGFWPFVGGSLVAWFIYCTVKGWRDYE